MGRVCYYCHKIIHDGEYLDIVFKDEVIGYICKECQGL